MDKSIRIINAMTDKISGNQEVFYYCGSLTDGTFFHFINANAIGIYDKPFPTHYVDPSKWQNEHLIRTEDDEEFAYYVEEYCRKANGKDLLACLALIELRSDNDEQKRHYMNELFGVDSVLKLYTDTDYETSCDKAKQAVVEFNYINI